MICYASSLETTHILPYLMSKIQRINKNLRTTSILQFSIKLISHTILEGIVLKLCGVETDGIFKNSEFKAISEHIDTDSLSFALLLEK